MGSRITLCFSDLFAIPFTMHEAMAWTLPEFCDSPDCSGFAIWLSSLHFQLAMIMDHVDQGWVHL